MAKVKHIQCNTLPSQLEPNAIYFVRDEQKIVQTDTAGVPVTFDGHQPVQVMTWGGLFWVTAGDYMIANKDSGIRSASMSGISANDDITAINSGYNKGYIVASTGARLRRLSGYTRIGVGAELPLIVGVKRYDTSGNLIYSEVLFKQNVTITNGAMWSIDIDSTVSLQQGDQIVFMIDARSLSGNVKVSQFLTQIEIA